MTTATEIKERGIIMHGRSVRAILDDFKSMTRRVVTRINGFGKVTNFGRSDTPGYDWTFRDKKMRWHDLRNDELLAGCPYGVPGDRLYVKEGVRWISSQLVYDADSSPVGMLPPSPFTRDYCPPMLMKKVYCRLRLEVVAVRVEQLHEMRWRAAEFEAEGIVLPPTELYPQTNRASKLETIFIKMWDSTNAKREGGAYAWAENPFPWVITFKRIEES